ncbi:DNA replication regulator SLD3-domain-containing protein [Ganoderma leucocontextum]|nr:DNA replication regulator SLD3-domain-containing protein [Ganoderma leucocontextum]
MPLQFLMHALLRATSASDPAATTSQQVAGHPLHSLLQPVLLTSRAVSHKYHTRIPSIISEESEPADPEEEYVWYAYHKDKVGEDERQEGQDDYEAQERLKNAWLEKYERREVQIQVLLYFLLVSLPKDRAGPSIEDARTAIADSLPLPPSLSPSKPKKRKHKDRGRGRAQDPPPQPLEERLESYMDKLAMWQLMQAVDSSLGRGETSRSAVGKEKDKQKDDRDWMQAFCEDVVEPLFKAKLPELCALFRSKLFPDAGNSDTSLGLSPPLSPKPATKRLKSSASASGSASSSRAASKPAANGKAKDAMRSRSNSLALSLEQEKRERERSRSLSLGPNGLRKRAIIPEVTMTTKFGKARAKQKAELERTASVPGPSLSRTQSQQAASGGSTDAKHVQKMGSVLVAATPTKPRDGTSRSQSQRTSRSQARLPSLFAGPSTSAWATSRLSSQTTLTRVDSLNIDTDDDDDDGGDAGLVATPTKARRKLALPQALGEHENDIEGNEWGLSNPSRTLSLGVSNSQEQPESEGHGPPTSSSPGDLGGFGEAITPPPRRATRSGGLIMVEDTPTKS